MHHGLMHCFRPTTLLHIGSIAGPGKLDVRLPAGLRFMLQAHCQAWHSYKHAHQESQGEKYCEHGRPCPCCRLTCSFLQGAGLVAMVVYRMILHSMPEAPSVTTFFK